MYEEIVRIVVTAAVFACVSIVLRAVVEKLMRDEELEAEIDLDELLKQLESNPEGALSPQRASSKVWRFDPTAPGITHNVEAA